MCRSHPLRGVLCVATAPLTGLSVRADSIRFVNTGNDLSATGTRLWVLCGNVYADQSGLVRR